MKIMQLIKLIYRNVIIIIFISVSIGIYYGYSSSFLKYLNIYTTYRVNDTTYAWTINTKNHKVRKLNVNYYKKNVSGINVQTINKFKVDDVDSFYSDCIKPYLSSTLGESIKSDGTKIKLLFHNQSPFYYLEDKSKSEVSIIYYSISNTPMWSYLLPFINHQLQTNRIEYKDNYVNKMYYSKISNINDTQKYDFINDGYFNSSIVLNEFKSIIKVESYDDFKKLYINHIKRNTYDFDDDKKTFTIFNVNDIDNFCRFEFNDNDIVVYEFYN